MHKRKLIILTIFTIGVFCSITSSLPIVHAINYTTSDVEDDVLKGCDPRDTGDYYDEIDIVNLNVAGRNINITVAGNFTSWGSSHSGSITFSPSIQVSPQNSLIFSSPWYAVDFENKSGPIEATLERGRTLDGNPVYEEWNGIGWENQSTATPVNIVLDVTEHSVICYIPDAVEEIPSNMKVIAKTHLWILSPTICTFSDITPLPAPPSGVPSYNLFILIGTMIGVSIIIIRKYRK